MPTYSQLMAKAPTIAGPAKTVTGSVGTPGATLPTGTTQYNQTFGQLFPDALEAQSQLSGNILSNLRGELSPETINAIQNQAARFGVLSGTPGSPITQSAARKLAGTTSQALQSQGLQDYLNTLQQYSGTLMPTTGEVIGAETSRYGIDVGARTAADRLAEEARQFGLTFPESQRQFDVAQALEGAKLSEQRRQFGLTFPESQRQFDYSQQEAQRQFDIANALKNLQFQQTLGLDYLNSYLNFLS